MCCASYAFSGCCRQIGLCIHSISPVVKASACVQVGLLSFPPRENELNKPYSDATALLIDQEVGTACLPFAVGARASICDRGQLYAVLCLSYPAVCFTFGAPLAAKCMVVRHLAPLQHHFIDTDRHCVAKQRVAACKRHRACTAGDAM